eukprot:1545699-Rhodomonas_salina.2
MKAKLAPKSSPAEVRQMSESSIIVFECVRRGRVRGCWAKQRREGCFSCCWAGQLQCAEEQSAQRLLAQPQTRLALAW